MYIKTKQLQHSENWAFGCALHFKRTEYEKQQNQHRITLRNKTHYTNQFFFKSKLVSKKSKLKLYWSIIRPIAGTRWRSRLRHCATNRRVAGLIPDDVSGCFHWHNPSGRTMALGLKQPLSEMSTRNISWG
jgi:hypothetical protein